MAKQYIDKDFLLHNPTARTLYHEYAQCMPIIDYHNHLPSADIAANRQFENITQLWLYGDHYKWRAMRTNGVSEEYCTGAASDRDKFLQWAATVPYTLRNPLHHWTHLELQRYFGIHELLNEKTASAIYDRCNEMLATPEFAVQGLLAKMQVKILCTTDDPVDDLRYHRQIKESGIDLKVFPAFRPDKAMAVENTAAFNAYLTQLEQASGITITSYAQFLQALRQRHDFFSTMGCCISDHGLEQIYAEPFTEAQAAAIFQKVRCGANLSLQEVHCFKSAMLVVFAEWDHEKGWVQQFHLGALRNNNIRRLRELGPDTGWDSIGDFSQAVALSKFLGRLDDGNKLAKTILYNLNPADNEVMATMAGNFNDGTVAGKIQWGSGWWFLDQKDGMTKQLNALSNMGLLSRFVGMLTDSRSFLSFPRHEYFRRLLCNIIGTDIEQGEIPDDVEWAGKIVQDICYHNAYNYFNWAW
jgi:glucuronate isomerase